MASSPDPVVSSCYSLAILSHPTFHFLLMPTDTFGGLHNVAIVRQVFKFILTGCNAMHRHVAAHYGVNVQMWDAVRNWTQLATSDVNERLDFRAEMQFVIFTGWPITSICYM